MIDDAEKEASEVLHSLLSVERIDVDYHQQQRRPPSSADANVHRVIETKLCTKTNAEDATNADNVDEVLSFV